MPASTQVIAVMGISYCGSTLLNLMLDTHPDIAGVGEVHALLDWFGEGYAKSCATCTEACPQWTPEVVRSLSQEHFYTLMAARLQARTLVDTSKTPQWFDASTRFQEEGAVRFVPVVMVKHPVRHLASLLLNHLAVHASEEEAATMLKNPVARRQAMATLLTRRLIPEYNAILSALPGIFGARPFHVVRYEGLVREPARELTPLLHDLGLAYDVQIPSCYAFPHHYIGGNSGAGYQYHKRDEDIKSPGGIKEAFYKHTTGIAMDDKYKAVFRDEEVAMLQRDPIVQDVCSKLGYTSL